MSAGGEPALQVQGVSKSFAGHLSLARIEVLNGIDLCVRQGEIYGFIGANGAGKTTTIKIVTGLIFAGGGEVRILGCPVELPESRRKVGYLPERPSFHIILQGPSSIGCNPNTLFVE